MVAKLVAMKPFQTMHNKRIQWCCKWKQDGAWRYVYDDNKKRCIEKQLARVAKLGNISVDEPVVKKPVPVKKPVHTIDFVFYERLESMDKKHEISEKHYKNTNNMYKKHIKPYLSDMDISVDSKTLNKYFNELETTDSNKNKIYKLLHALFEYSIKNGYIQFNPTNSVNKPAYNNKTRALEIDKTNQIILTLKGIINMLSYEQCKYHEYYNMFLLLTLGLRASELIGLTQESLNYADSSLTVSTQLRKENGAYYLKLGTKGKLTDFHSRTIPIGRQYKQAILDETNKHKDAVSLPVKLNDEYMKNETRHALFIKNNKPFDYNNLTYIWKRIQDEYHRIMLHDDTKPTYIRLHAFRHMAATQLAEQGENIQIAQAILGHMNPSMTEYYTHLTASMMKATAERFENNMLHEMTSLNYGIEQAMNIDTMLNEQKGVIERRSHTDTANDMD
ncbi:integrase family protein [Bifidobacterium saguini DSM 23967]|uniref:Integrase family protein n=2 Tax=Bifidobacterium saguini TaxID=762210 RepID=A0A087DEV1_9BIFI|nr:tyrosine-type recombinase/integrase [Bifidobacterium saguini]KFI94051.1 integrase family protein [Bifidobacterium saguini DSM 23967]QTB90360.1 tyrosine-type recombinase/integrase [Bifidobacterium saguini]